MKKGRERIDLFLKVLGWSAGILGALFAVFGTFGAIALFLRPVQNMYATMPNIDPEWAASMAQLLRVTGWISLLKVPFYVGAAVAGFGILERKPWSRGLMEAMLWSFIVISLASVIYFGLILDPMASMPKFIAKAGTQAPDMAKFTQGMGLVIRVLGFVVTLFWCAILAVIAVFLRQPDTRRRFKA